MKRLILTSLALLAGAGLFLGLYLGDGGVPVEPQALVVDEVNPAPPGPDDTRVNTEATPPATRAAGAEPEPAVSAEQLAREIYERSIVKSVQSFRTELQGFIRDAELLPAQDHEPKARELLAEVDKLLTAGYLTGPEALALQLSLLKYVLPPDDYRATASMLVSEARQRAEQAEREWAARSDPKLERYRDEERRIVEQTAAMEDFPNGMTRQEYLRQKLRDLRSEIYSE